MGQPDRTTPTGRIRCGAHLKICLRTPYPTFVRSCFYSEQFAPTNPGPTVTDRLLEDQNPSERGQTRRAFLRGSLGATVLALLPTAAVQALTKKNTPTTAAKATTKSRPNTTAKSAKTTVTAPATTNPSAATTKSKVGGATFNSAKELTVAFTYASDTSGFGFHNPFIAVYIEDGDGNLVRTINLSIQKAKSRYWPELRSWWRMDQTRISAGGIDDIETISSPTRVPGKYNVIWDGRNEKKQPVVLGEYYLNIEAAMEHGPYDVIREPITISDTTFTKKIADSGSLQGVSVGLRAKG